MPNNPSVNNENSAYEENSKIYRQPIKPTARPQPEIGIDTTNSVYDNIINMGKAEALDINALNSFQSTARSRDQIYTLLDTMCQDSKVSAVLETYAEDTTEMSEEGRIVWCESSEPNIQHYISYLLDSINVDKHVYSWAYGLCKYGDVYLRMFRESDIEDNLLFSNTVNKKTNKRKRKLDESVRLRAYKENDHFVPYVEMQANPAQIFELTKYGKTQAYIKADIASTHNTSAYAATQQLFQYSFSKGNVDLHGPTDFVHGSLVDNSSRTPETVRIFLGNEVNKDGGEGGESLLYTVRRGQSLFYNMFKTWRELSLLENSLLLNRVTKSSIVRIISVEVGDMPKEQVGPHLMGIKGLIEQKSALSAGGSLQEYTNPGPIENNVYIPTHEGVGVITTTEVGGNPDVKSILDVDYYLNQFYGGLRVPKQYFSQTDDAAGFSGGQSLAVISSRYAKMIKRIQNTVLQMIYDLVNLFLIDRGLTSYINKYTLKMQAPTTQEELDRRENVAGKIQLVNDIYNMLSDVQDIPTKLGILKSLLSNVVTNNDVIKLLDKEIKRLTAEQEAQQQKTPEETSDVNENGDTESVSEINEPMPEIDTSLDGLVGGGAESAEVSLDSGIDETPYTDTSSDQILPTPADMGVDLT